VTGEQRRRAITRPREHERVAGERRQREAREHHQVEHEHRRATQPRDRRTEQRRHDQRLGKGERVLRGIEDIGLEKMKRRAGKGVRNPRQDPLVQLRIAVVVSREHGRRCRKWPGVDDGQRGTEDRREYPVT
jgi:hypothetical protein